MFDESGYRRHLYLAVAEVVVFGLAFAFFALDLLAEGSVAGVFERPVLVAVVAFVGAEFLISAWILWDVHRQPLELDPIWVHVATMPLVNVFGIAAYRWKRAQVREAAATTENASDTR